MPNRKVLIIDDDPIICDLVETVLRLEQFDASSKTYIPAGNIIGLLEQELPQLLILDYHLQAENTIEYLPIIRANQDWQEVLILMASGIDCRAECLAAGADGFLLKPFDLSTLTTMANQFFP